MKSGIRVLAGVVLTSALAVQAADTPWPNPPWQQDMSGFGGPPRMGLWYRFEYGVRTDAGAKESKEWSRPPDGEGDVITLDYSGVDEEGREFVNTFTSGKPVTVALGRLSDNYFIREEDKSPIAGVGKGWDYILRMVKKGDSVSLIMNPEMAVLPGAALLPQDGRLYFKATVTNIAYAKEPAIAKAKAEMAAEKVAAPADSKAFKQQGYKALYEDKDAARALKYFRWNLALFPGQVELYEHLGEAYLQQGDVPHAIEAYERVLKGRKDGNAELVVYRLKADARSVTWLQEQARSGYRPLVAKQ